MNIYVVKKYIKNYYFKTTRFKYNAGRGQIDDFIGKIIELYDRTFVIETSDGKIKSFSYSDILIRNLTILD